MVFFLQVYLPLVLVAALVQPSAAPAVIILPTTSTAYHAVFGYMLYGEVQNLAPYSVARLRVTATRPNGESVSEMVMIGRLSPGEKGCFALRTQSATPWDDAILAVDFLPSASERSSAHTVLEQSATVDNGKLSIAGTIRNDHPAPVRGAHLVVTHYAADRVIGCQDVTLRPARLLSGETGTFAYAVHANVPVTYTVAFGGEGN